jgi:hypothetical protein
MSLPKAIQGAIRTSIYITFLHDRTGCPYVLDDIEISAIIKDMETGDVRLSTGTFTIIDSDQGEFLWKYSMNDVSQHGAFVVQFKATSTITGDYDLSFETPWRVIKSQ